MKDQPEGKWTKSPPGGDVAFCYDRDELAEWIKHTQALAEEAKKTGAPPPQDWTVPRVAQRFALPHGVYWLVSGSSRLWPEASLKKKVVWWSKPVNIPRINFVLAKELAVDVPRTDSPTADAS